MRQRRNRYLVGLWLVRWKTAAPISSRSVALNAVVMYLVLALQNRGFTEIGSRGIRAQDMAATLPDLIAANEAVSERLFEAVEAIAETQQQPKGGAH